MMMKMAMPSTRNISQSCNISYIQDSILKLVSLAPSPPSVPSSPLSPPQELNSSLSHLSCFLGCHNFKRWMVNAPEKPQLAAAVSHVTDDLPLYRRASCMLPSPPASSLFPSLTSPSVNLGNLEISEVLTQKQVHEQKLWPWAENVIQKTYFEL
jgi:hypothetical protein